MNLTLKYAECIFHSVDTGFRQLRANPGQRARDTLVRLKPQVYLIKSKNFFWGNPRKAKSQQLTSGFFVVLLPCLVIDARIIQLGYVFVKGFGPQSEEKTNHSIRRLRTWIFSRSDDIESWVGNH